MTIVFTDVYGLKKLDTYCVLTIGNFDGVHKGHQVLLSLLKEESKAKNLKSVVITFDPHPLKTLSGNPPPFITPLEQKLELISQFEPDFILVLRFNEKFARIEAEQFVKRYMVDSLGLKLIIVGHDYKFGKDGKGDYNLLKELGKKYGFDVKRVEPVEIDGEIVSSTKIRELVQKGDMEKARLFLGRFYEVRGVVVEGQKRGGPILGVPTANLKLMDELYPRRGVYAVFVELKGDRFFGVANVGFNPTFGENPISVEVHLFDFSRDIYGEKIRVQFVKRLRDEKKFSSIEALKKQIIFDIERAKQELKNWS